MPSYRGVQLSTAPHDKRLCLNMIVKNEASNIERCLLAASPVISAWVICDTGSTDDTEQIVERFFSQRGIPGELHRFRFVNFEQARNEALDRARASPLSFDYLLLTDADMELVVEDAGFRANLSAECYAVRQKNQLSYFNTRLLRRDVAARYKGVTHEFLNTVDQPPRLEGIWFIDHASGSNRVGKFERDIKLLQETLRDDPTNARNVFYLAQSLRDAGRLGEARNMYLRRSVMAGWEEETWYALLQVAQLTERLGDAPPAIERAYLAAYTARPTRAEPLLELARWHRERKEWAMTLLYARAAAVTDRPLDRLFLDEASYAWRPWDEIAIAAWYVGAHDEGRRAAQRLLAERRFPPSELQRIDGNCRFYALDPDAKR